MTIQTIFISGSSDLPEERSASAAAIESMGLRPDVYEGWTALSEAPEAASVRAVRESDILVLLIGSRYGTLSSAGRSIVHEEYLAARASGIPVLPFRIGDGELEARQVDFVAAVQQNETIRRVMSIDDLKAQVTRGVVRELVRKSSIASDATVQPAEVPVVSDRRATITIDLQTEEIANLRDAVTKQVAEKLNDMRALFRKGRVDDAMAGLAQLISDPVSKRVDAGIRSRVLTTLATFKLGTGSAPEEIEALVRDAKAADPEGDFSHIDASIRYVRDGANAALAGLENVQTINTLNLKIALLLDVGQ
ncbi:MAG: hypothetical protein QOJ98_7, partial [Acidobacteriota bacterium]|nr:hypothetical protein [Acidobacteriota bacterium]